MAAYYSGLQTVHKVIQRVRDFSVTVIGLCLALKFVKVWMVLYLRPGGLDITKVVADRLVVDLLG